MRANELMIGNYVSTTEILIQKHKIEAEDIISIIDGSFEKLGLEVLPISLTEEWLIKFGFEKRKDIFYKFGNYPHTISLNKNGESYRVEIVSQSIAWIKHVHQLQNLHFALTNEELL